MLAEVAGALVEAEVRAEVVAGANEADTGGAGAAPPKPVERLALARTADDVAASPFETGAKRNKNYSSALTSIRLISNCGVAGSVVLPAVLAVAADLAWF